MFDTFFMFSYYVIIVTTLITCIILIKLLSNGLLSLPGSRGKYLFLWYVSSHYLKRSLFCLLQPISEILFPLNRFCRYVQEHRALPKVWRARHLSDMTIWKGANYFFRLEVWGSFFCFRSINFFNQYKAFSTGPFTSVWDTNCGFKHFSRK